MKVYLDSVGCRLNQSEIETLARQLLASGHEVVTTPADADKVIVNTCTVTREADRDSRSRTRRFHRANPKAEVILTGCYATMAPDELNLVEGVGRIVSNKDKDRLIQLIDPSAQAHLPIYDHEPVLRDFPSLSMGRTRAFIKVQDGCDNLCTFCITTIARGSGASRNVGEVVAEIQGLVESGYKEAVLTGVHLGSYGNDLGKGHDLTALVNAVLDHTDILRLRLSSLEPWDIPDHFFDLWTNPRLLPHLHVPLQSGSDKILRRMARRTSRSSFREIVTSAKQSIPNLNLSTDLIAGFPGEDEREFEETVSFISEMSFSRLHVFSYSRRPGTAAAQMDGQIPKNVKRNRVRKLIEIGKSLSLNFHKRNEGRLLSVLWERAEKSDQNDRSWIGYSENYIRVRAVSRVDISNQITPAIVSDASADGMKGTIRLGGET